MALHRHSILINTALLLVMWSGLTLSAENSQPRPITTKLLSELVVYPGKSAPAQVLSLNESRISTQLSALVGSVAVKVGDKVKRGEPLITLICDDARLQLNQVQASVAVIDARLEWLAAQLKRSEQLHSSDSLSAELLQQRQSELKVSEAERAMAIASTNMAKLNVARCEVNAPFSGVVTSRLVAEGEWITTGTPVVTLLDTLRLELSAQIGVDDLEMLRQAKRVEFVAQDQRYPLALRAAPEKVDPRLRQREVRFNFTDNTPLPGQVGRLEWKNSIAHLPADLIVKRAGHLGIFVIEQEQAHFIILSDAIEGRPASVKQLPSNALIAVEGRHSLRDGDRVMDAR